MACSDASGTEPQTDAPSFETLTHEMAMHLLCMAQEGGINPADMVTTCDDNLNAFMMQYAQQAIEAGSPDVSVDTTAHCDEFGRQAMTLGSDKIVSTAVKCAAAIIGKRVGACLGLRRD